METTRVMSVRLAPELADEAAVVARVDGISISRVIRLSMAKHIAERVADPEFKKRLQARVKDDLQVAKRMLEEA